MSWLCTFGLFQRLQFPGLAVYLCARGAGAGVGWGAVTKAAAAGIGEEWFWVGGQMEGVEGVSEGWGGIGARVLVTVWGSFA